MPTEPFYLSPVLPPGRELDTTLSLLLNGEARRNPPPYSTSPLASDRLLRRLSRQGLSARVEEWGGLWYCTLFQGTSRIASGSGETKPLAVSRAVLGCRFGIPTPSAGATSARVDRAMSRAEEGVHSCQECGSPLNPTKARATLRRLCNVCSWKRDKVRLAEPRLPALPSSRREPSP
ncbi:MAG: hypothetical protein ABI682_11710 [Acidobacteriota bacterium]